MDQADAASSEVPPLSELIASAADFHRQAAGQEDYEAIWPVLDEAVASRDVTDEAATFARQALEAGLALLGSTDPSERAVGCDLMGTLCNPDEHGWGADERGGQERFYFFDALAGERAGGDLEVAVEAVISDLWSG